MVWETVSVEDLTDAQVKEVLQLLLQELGYYVRKQVTPDYEIVRLKKDPARTPSG
jgi:hypothetical protein